MNDEQLQFAISQYIDGTLPDDERAVLEQRLASDPQARQLLAEYRRLDKLITAGLPATEIEMDWAALASQISDAVAKEAEQVNEVRESESIPPTYTLPWVWKASALAASILICIGLLILYHGGNQPAGNGPLAINPPSPPSPPVPPAPPTPVPQSLQGLDIAVLTTENAVGSPFTTVNIGPATFANIEEIPTEASVTIAGAPMRQQDDSNNVLQ